MKAWLGAAAAVSGVGTLVYLMARSGRRRDTGHAGTALGTHTAKGGTTEDSCVSRDSQDTGDEKDGPYDQMNGHVPIEGNTKESLMPADTDPEEYHSEATEQKLCGNLLTSNETSDVKSSVEGLSSNSENVSDYVSVIENEAVVKECTNSVSHACIEVRPHMDSGGTGQQARVKAAVTESASDHLHMQAKHEQNDSVVIQEQSVETREAIKDDMVMPSVGSENNKTVASGELVFAGNIVSDEKICSDVNSLTLLENTCDPGHTEAAVEEISDTRATNNPQVSADLQSESSLPAAKPVSEELSQCVILKPQCDPLCCELLTETCHPPISQMSIVSSSEITEPFLDEAGVTSSTLAAAQTIESDPQAELHYNLVLKSDKEDISISGKHIHDAFPSEHPTEDTVELIKEETVTGVISQEQRSQNTSIPAMPDSTFKEIGLVHSEVSVVEGKDLCVDPEARDGEPNDSTVESTSLVSSKREVTQEQEHNIIQQQEVTEEKEQSGCKQELSQEEEQSVKKQEVTGKQEPGGGTQEQMEQKHYSNTQETSDEQRQGDSEQEITNTQEESGTKQERTEGAIAIQQEISKSQEQGGSEHDVKESDEGERLVTAEQVAESPSRCDGSKKGSVRSRGDSASADLDCDLGSEQDNQNCDSSSLKSVDSGQGSSEIEPETLFISSTFPVSNQEQYIFYDFEIPQMLVGRLIGRKGAFINKIKATTDATVIVHPHKNRKLKLCSVEGTKPQVNAALELIRKHFPESQYPDITLRQVSSQQQSQPQVQPALNAQSMQIELTAGVVVEVRVSAVVSGGELWVQQPLHPSYSALHRLQTCMNLNYGDGSTTPPLPSPMSDGTVCVAHISDHWLRCQVFSSSSSTSLVLLLDAGGTASVPSSSLRQIRYDYMTLPFQASQCFLHGVQPVTGDTWSDAAASVMEELVSGVILYAVVVSYTEDCVPLVNLYRRDQNQFVLLNEKLVELGHAQWISLQPSS